jgi:anaerobic magnesium-protoporphyrin IX monomethyl ester cyclase
MKIERVAVVAPSLPYATLVSQSIMVEDGVPVIATAVRNAGYETILHAEVVQEIDWDLLLEADAVCFHTYSCTVPKVKQYVERIRRERPGVPIIIGGTHATVMVEDTLLYADYVIRQEGDEALPELLGILKNGGDVSRILGISYTASDGTVHHNPNRPYVRDFSSIPDMELINGFKKWTNKWKLLLQRKIYWNILQTSRGCPFNCSFCIAPRDIGRAYRKRDIEAVVEDIRYQRELTGRKRLFVVDNHFTVNPKRTKQLLRRIIKEKLNWGAVCFTRIEVAKDEEMLRLMKEAGVIMLFIGLESFDSGVLELLNKGAPKEGIPEDIARVRSHGINVLGSFVLSSDSDSVATIRKTIDSAIELDLDLVTLFPLSGYPEKNGLIPMNRFFFDDWSRLDGGFVIFLPKHMKPSTLQREINRAYRRFYGPRQMMQRLLKGNFRGFLWRVWYRWRVFQITRGNDEWIEHLEAVEDENYDENEELIEERLGEGIVPCQIPGGGARTDLELSPVALELSPGIRTRKQVNPEAVAAAGGDSGGD